eukprot:ANDGO_00847.mRNA.1 Cytochrome P450 98A1
MGWKILGLAGAAAAAGFPAYNLLRYESRCAAMAAKYVNSVSGKTPRGPPTVPLFGNSLALGKDYEGTVLNACLSVPDEPLVLFWVGSSPFLVANNPSVVRRALATDRYDKPAYVGYRSKSVKMAVAMETPKTELHMHGLDHPDASRPVFQAIVKNQYPEISRHIDQYANSIMQSCKVAPDLSYREGKVLSALHPMFTRINLSILFNFHDAERSERLSRLVLSAGDEFQKRLINPYRWALAPLSNFGFVKDVALLIREGRRLTAHLDETTGSWVHAWVTREGLHPLRYFGKVIGLLIAATQTVPPSAAWAMYYLSQPQNAEYRQKLREEIDRALPIDRPFSELSFEDAQENLPFAEAVCREVLRLKPAFPLLQRAALSNDDVDGYTIPKGTVINVVPALLHRNPQYWSRPEEFRPDRFLEVDGVTVKPNGDSSSPFAYLPFGRGPRMCIGASLGLLELKLFVARMSREFDWVCVEDSNKKDFMATFSPRR